MFACSNVHLIAIPLKSKIDLKSIKLIAYIVKKHNIQIVNAQASIDRYLSIFTKWLYGFNLKLVHTRRQVPKSSGSFIQGLFYTIGTNKIVAVSNGIKRALHRTLLIPYNHIKVIYNGTPVEKYANTPSKDINQLKDRFTIRNGDIVIGCVSRHKQQEQLINALNLIKSMSFKVFFIGITIKDLNEKLINSLPDNHTLYFLGKIPPDDVLDFYRLFDIFILPSITEGLSQSLLESIFLNVPIIATKAAGNIDLINHNTTGLLFENNNIKELSDFVIILASSLEERLRLSKNAKEMLMRRFTIEKTIDKYEKFFLWLLNQ